VLHIELPALRERRADIPILIENFLQQTSAEHDLEPVLISPEALRILQDYAWPGNIRELRNLVESMVVFGQGRAVQPEDIPPEVRSGNSKTILPAPNPRALRKDGAGAGTRGDGSGPAPELEFIFRTLMQLRVDMEDIRRDFEEFRRAHPELLAETGSSYPVTAAERAIPGVRHTIPGGVEVASITAQAEEFDDVIDDGEDENVVVFRPGKTMSDLEREAIIAALGEVGGNRRKAAEMLGIGERTLYRKLKEYKILV
jgi:DNA-binding NtrC family response regulator